ncbi:MAG: hypothetical protein KGJ66_13625 [Alphaproteobacteria bacterium]|nr:hypothetical protein [Alphaproteobacteria bacterium]
MADYYVRLIDDGLTIIEDFWAVEDNVAHQGIVPSQLGTHYANSGEDIMTTLQKRFSVGTFHKLLLGPGEYFPRMARPDSIKRECSPGHYPDRSDAARNIRTTNTGQLHVLIQELQQICQVVQPEKANFAAYGHEIRNIIILACTEVEAQWKNILEANGQQGESRLDYVRLALPMKLGEYRVALAWYPWLEPIAPFEKWVPVPRGSKQCLPWYDAYNNIKHDPEKNFAQATLIHALKSITACFVMLCAQYGWDFAKRGEAAEDAFFRLIEAPRWGPSEIYAPPCGTTPKERPYPF